MKKTVSDLLNEWGMSEGKTVVLNLANTYGGENYPAYGQTVTVWRDSTNFYTYEIKDKDGRVIEKGDVNKLDIPGHPVPMNAGAIKTYFKVKGFMEER